MWKVKVTVVPLVIRLPGVVTPKLREWLQQIPGQHLRSLSRSVQSWEQLRYCTEPSQASLVEDWICIVCCVPGILFTRIKSTNLQLSSKLEK